MGIWLKRHAIIALVIAIAFFSCVALIADQGLDALLSGTFTINAIMFVCPLTCLIFNGIYIICSYRNRDFYQPVLKLAGATIVLYCVFLIFQSLMWVPFLMFGGISIAVFLLAVFCSIQIGFAIRFLGSYKKRPSQNNHRMAVSTNVLIVGTCAMTVGAIMLFVRIGIGTSILCFVLYLCNFILIAFSLRAQAKELD